MKFPIHIHIHIHRCLSCVHAATKFPQSTAGARGSILQRQRHRHSPPKFVIIIWNCLRINTYLHWNMCFVKYFENFYENRCNSNAPVFSRMQVAFYFCMEWTPLVHVWFLLPTSIENVGKQKRKRVQLIKPILIIDYWLQRPDTACAHKPRCSLFLVTRGRKYRNKMQVYFCNIFQAFSFKMTLQKSNSHNDK